METDGWPALPYDEWRDTRDTLHMYTQVVGKLRLALCPFEPQWANVPLYLTARGLTTSVMPVGLSTVDAELDLVDHVLVLRAGSGDVERRELGAPVADFYSDTMEALRRLGVDVEISSKPSEVANPIPFAEDRQHAAYDRAQVTRFFRVLSMVDVVMRQHRARFRGRTTPVSFFWGTFDLALTRFSGRSVPPPPGAGVIDRFSAGEEEISAGWWPGDERVPRPAFYTYAAPKPDGIESIGIAPGSAAWSDAAGEFLLSYDDARGTPDPQRTILDFLDSTYAGAAALLGWDERLTAVPAPRHTAPTPMPVRSER